MGIGGNIVVEWVKLLFMTLAPQIRVSVQVSAALLLI